MPIAEQKLNKLSKLLEMMDESLTREEFVKAFEAITKLILDLEKKHIDKIDFLLEDLASKTNKKLSEVKDGEDGKDYILTNKDKDEIAGKIKVLIKEQPVEIVKEVAVAESAEKIRNKIESLEGDDKLDKPTLPASCCRPTALASFVKRDTNGSFLSDVINLNSN